MKIAAIIPAFNEEKSIAKVIDSIPGNYIEEIIVVNNNSQDRTARKAEEAGATVLYEAYQGYGAACLNAVRYLDGKGFDIVVFLDGDYSDFPEEVGLLLNPIIKQGCDFVLGSRVLGKREKGALPLQSRIGSIIAGNLIRLFWKFRYTDLGPFRAIKYEKLVSLDMRDRWYGWTVEMQIKALKKNLRIKEIPVSYRKRIGRSKVTGTLKGSVMAGIIILKTIFSELIRR